MAKKKEAAKEEKATTKAAPGDLSGVTSEQLLEELLSRGGADASRDIKAAHALLRRDKAKRATT